MKIILENFRSFRRLVEYEAQPMPDAGAGSTSATPLAIGQAATVVGAMRDQPGYMFYTIDGKRPAGESDIEKLSQPGTVLRHHFSPGTDIVAMTQIVNKAHQTKALQSVMNYRSKADGSDDTHPARAFFAAGLAFSFSPDKEQNAVKLIVRDAPHLRDQGQAPSVAPGLPPQR